MTDKCDVSLVLACYNEAEHFTKSISRIVQVLDETDFSWEIIFIDDASKDNTPSLIRDFVKTHPRKQLAAYYHERNYGRGATVAEGIEKSNGKVVGYIDIDLEIPPDYMPQFIREIEKGTDVVCGWRIYDFTIKSLPRWIASKGYNVVRNRGLQVSIRDTEAGYKFFKRKSILSVLKKCKSPGWFWDTEIMVRAKNARLKIKEIPVVFIRRFDKTSTVRLIPDTFVYLRELWRFRQELQKSS